MDEYYDEFGGIDGRNKLHGTKWRKHLNGTSYSKVSQLIKGINANAETNGMQPESVIAEWEGIFTACKHSANNMVKALQSLGKLKKLLSIEARLCLTAKTDPDCVCGRK